MILLAYNKNYYYFCLLDQQFFKHISIPTDIYCTTLKENIDIGAGRRIIYFSLWMLKLISAVF